MILSQTAEYAIRAVVSIAVQETLGPVRAADLSRDINIPAHYLSKVLRRLVKGNLLSGSKGHRGGFLLARPADKISIIDVLEVVESAIPEKHCIFGWRMCNSKAPCILHHHWSSVNTSFQVWARETTLADIKNQASLSKWLLATKSLQNTLELPPEHSPTRKVKPSAQKGISQTTPTRNTKKS